MKMPWKCFDEALSIEPQNSQCIQSNKVKSLIGIGDSLLKSKNYVIASKKYDEALKISQNNEYALNGKFEALNGTGKYIIR